MRGAAGGANLRALRSHNTALVLDLLRTAGGEGISRLELAERTGLTPQAVSKITARLRGEGLAAEAGRRASTGGKPRTVLRLVPGAGHALGVHLDRDELRAVLVDLDGTVVAERRAPLDLGAGAETVLEEVARAAEELATEGLGGPPGADGPRPPTTKGPAPAAGEDVRSPGGGGARAGAVDGRGSRAGAGSRASASEGLEPPVSGERFPVGPEHAAGEDVRSPGGGGARAGAVDGRGSWAGDGSRASVPEGLEPPVTGERLPVGPGPVAGEGARSPGGVLAAAPTLLGLGVALPGPLDHVRGVLHRVTGFPGWDGYPLRDALERRLGVPVVVDKDTNAAALGLAVGGAGGRAGDAGAVGGSFAYLHLGTGLGAGLVLGGGVHRGARTGAGEFGHQVVQLDGPPCTCGARGCIEALCLAAVARGDLAEAARVLGTGAANLAGLLDIDLVLLGGRTVAAAPEAFVHGVRAVLEARARREGGHDGPVPVRLAPAGTRGVAEGAAQLVLAPLFGRGEGG
ncbi:ROK family transcriptional regulator [Streptomyces tendae]|uniref:ROK family transcriptional regulator n=1 Tax=Streptomyces tendae TaxID=1932 RepID=UPI003408D33F